MPVSGYSEKIPPAFDVHSSYDNYRKDVALWLLLTSLEPKKQKTALIGWLSGKPYASAKTLTTEDIGPDDGAAKIRAHLSKSCAVNKTQQLDQDLAAFLNFTWQGGMRVEQFVTGRSSVR